MVTVSKESRIHLSSLIYLKTLLNFMACIESNGEMNVAAEVEITWNEAIMDHSRHYCSIWIEELNRTLRGQTACVRAKNWYMDIPNTEHVDWPLNREFVLPDTFAFYVHEIPLSRNTI
jgi:hypothetical protein